MRPSLVPKAIHVCLAANRSLLLWGSPGVGKSNIVDQYAKANDYELVDLRLSQLDPVDLRGCPKIDLEAMLTRWAPPDFLPQGGRGIIFLDEITSAAQATQAAAYQLVFDRRLGNYVVPPEWRIIGASNRMTDRAIVNQMATPLRNRFTSIDVDTHADDWCRWAMRNDIADEVIGFIRFRPEMLNEFEPRAPSPSETQRMTAVRESRSFGTQRSWHALSDEFKVGIPKEIEAEMYTGNVGTVCSAEFHAYMTNLRNMPNLDVILLNPGNARVPTEPSAKYAVSVGLAARSTPDNFDRVMQYAVRLDPEFQSLLVRDAQYRRPELTNTKAFQQWAIANANELL